MITKMRTDPKIHGTTWLDQISESTPTLKQNDFNSANQKAIREKLLTMDLIPKEQKQELQDLKLKYIRYWLILIVLAQFANLIM